jgi:hypothetical protein
MPDFNLLHYPTLDRQQSLRRQWRSGLVGAFLGIALAGSAVAWWSWQTEQLQQTRQSVQAQWVERKRQTDLRQQQRQQDQSVQQQLAQLSLLQSRQQAWLLLQSSVMEEAQSQGLRLQRLQVEAGRVEIQGQAPSAQVMSDAAQRLSDRWGQPLHLLSLEALPASEAASKGVSFVWQGTWPGLTEAVVQTHKARP